MIVWLEGESYMGRRKEACEGGGWFYTLKVMLQELGECQIRKDFTIILRAWDDILIV